MESGSVSLQIKWKCCFIQMFPFVSYIRSLCPVWWRGSVGLGSSSAQVPSVLRVCRRWLKCVQSPSDRERLRCQTCPSLPLKLHVQRWRKKEQGKGSTMSNILLLIIIPVYLCAKISWYVVVDFYFSYKCRFTSVSFMFCWKGLVFKI